MSWPYYIILCVLSYIFNGTYSEDIDGYNGMIQIEGIRGEFINCIVFLAGPTYLWGLIDRKGWWNIPFHHSHQVL